MEPPALGVSHLLAFLAGALALALLFYWFV
jgi:hypothetical protein